MEHSYLSKTEIKAALTSHAITKKEAEKLNKKIECQVKIYKATHK